MATRRTPDPAHQQTDKLLEDLERRVGTIYKQAADEMQLQVTQFFAAYKQKDAEKRDRLNAGEITPEEYRQWRLAQMARGSRFEAMRDTLAERMTKANEVAAAYINDVTPGVYSLNRNYSAYTIEKVAGNVGFTLFDEATVRRLIVEQPDLMPYYPEKRAIQRGIDLAWGKRQITAHVTSGILRGQSIPDLAKDLLQAIPSMNRASAVRAARTAVTGAQNGGRMASYKAAADMGIKVRKRWTATKDGRTRRSHASLDGETVPWDETFSNGLMYPGDPSGPAREVYNCRCTVRTAEKAGIEAEPRQMRVRDPETGKNVLVNEMTYSEWERWKKATQPPVVSTGRALEFSGIKDAVGEDFVNGMREKLQASGSDLMVRMYDSFGDRIKVVDTNLKSGAYFSPRDMGVHFNTDRVAQGDSLHLPYQTAFHEFAHNIDYLAGPGFQHLSTTYNGGLLPMLIKSDYKAFKKAMGARSNAVLLDMLKAEGLPISESGSLSDILEGCTGVSYPLGVGHGASYHKRWAGATAAEFFAEVCDGLAANKKSYDQLKRVFPNAVELVEEMIEEALKK